MASINSEINIINTAKNNLAEALIAKFGIRRKDNAATNPTLKGLWTVDANGNEKTLKRLSDWTVLVNALSVNADTLNDLDSSVFFRLDKGVAISATLASPSDLNNYVTPGTYYSGGASISQYINNLPNDSVKQANFKLIVMFHGIDNLYFRQILYAGASNDVYYRLKSTTSSNWGDWKKIAFDGHTHYWANIATTSSASYNKEPEVKTLILGNGTTSAAVSGNRCKLLFDNTSKCVKFIFD